MTHTAQKNTFQFRFATSKWMDIELSNENLDEIVAALNSAIGTRSPSAAYPELYKMIRENHQATKELDPKLYDISDLAFEVVSNEEDVLKVQYSFTKLFGNKDETEIAVKTRNLYNRRTEAKRREIVLMEDKEPKAVEGLFIIMPGN
jgi:hypothetical protein